MATENKVLNTRIKLKRDTSANWESNNPTLLNGEIIIVDTAAGEVRFKIGDGSKTYTQLPFEDEGVRNLIADKSKITVETWTDSSGSTAQFLNELVINKVKDRQTYEEMVDAGKIDTNELYFIEEDDEVAVTPVLTTGEKIATITIGDDITDIYAPLTGRTIKNSYVIDSGLPLEIDTHDFAMETKAVVSGTATYGTINVIDATTIRYIPTTILLGVDNVELTFNDESTYTISIIPATTISYDEKFITFTNSTAATDSDGDGEVDGMGVWSLVTDENYDENANIVQTQDGVYGYDSVNNSYSKYSFGKAKTVTINQTTGSYSADTSASFTFTGTGFDVISVSNSRAGVIYVWITDATGATFYRVVDTYNGHEYNAETGEWIVAENSTTLWQLPVMKITDLAYGTYNIKVQASYLLSMDNLKTGSYSFWLDSVRIYNTAGIAGTDYTSNDLIGSKYLTDEEYNSTYVNLKGKYSVLDDTTVKDTAIIKLKRENDIYTPIVKSNKYDAIQYKLCIGPGMIYAFEVGDIVDEPKCQLGIQLYTNTADTEAQVSFIDSFDVSGQQTHSLSQAIGTPTEMYYKVSIVKYGDKSYVVVKNISATAYVAINSAKLFNCNIITQTDEASINAFIANITKIANGTAVGALLDGKLPQPETAEVGNLISVKEVDENGKVTATDVIDISAEAAMELSAEMGLINPVADEEGSIYVDENDLIYTI